MKWLVLGIGVLVLVGLGAVAAFIVDDLLFDRAFNEELERRRYLK